MCRRASLTVRNYSPASCVGEFIGAAAGLALISDQGRPINSLILSRSQGRDDVENVHLVEGVL